MDVFKRLSELDMRLGVHGCRRRRAWRAPDLPTLSPKTNDHACLLNDFFLRLSPQTDKRFVALPTPGLGKAPTPARRRKPAPLQRRRRLLGAHGRAQGAADPRGGARCAGEALRG